MFGFNRCVMLCMRSLDPPEFQDQRFWLKPSTETTCFFRVGAMGNSGSADFTYEARDAGKLPAARSQGFLWISHDKLMNDTLWQFIVAEHGH